MYKLKTYAISNYSLRELLITRLAIKYMLHSAKTFQSPTPIIRNLRMTRAQTNVYNNEDEDVIIYNVELMKSKIKRNLH